MCVASLLEDVSTVRAEPSFFTRFRAFVCPEVGNIGDSRVLLGKADGSIVEGRGSCASQVINIFGSIMINALVYIARPMRIPHQSLLVA